METRQITQAHIYFLTLNCVYDRCEGRDIVAVSDEHQKLVDLFQAQLLPMEKRYRDDHGMYRSFEKGPLYDYNPPYDMGEEVRDEWVDIEEVGRIQSRYHWVY